tara:strand:- start:23945 stop:24379 length:435 start_codon:yes stop_codon:yes gene_type:complete
MSTVKNQRNLFAQTVTVCSVRPETRGVVCPKTATLVSRGRKSARLVYGVSVRDGKPAVTARSVKKKNVSLTVLPNSAQRALLSVRRKPLRSPVNINSVSKMPKVVSSGRRKSKTVPVNTIVIKANVSKPSVQSVKKTVMEPVST